jgi:very-short-patch-repair endonuclease
MKSAADWLKNATTTLSDVWQATPRAPRFPGSWTQWDAIRSAWDVQRPAILAGIRVSPYFYKWSMTPIEAAAWQALREHGLPLYPQCPVGDLFIDFGDPVQRIGLELDGKDFHDYERDKSRDIALWRVHGWRIIRIGGSACYEKSCGPADADFADGADRNTKEYLDDLGYWAENSAAGIIWSMAVSFYRHPATEQELSVARWSLFCHRRVEFNLPGQEDDALMQFALSHQDC